MKKREIVKERKDYNNIIQKGQKTKSKYFKIFFLKTNSEIPLFGFAVSKKLGNAVYRNKIRRQLKNIIDKNKIYFQNNRKYIIMINSDGAKLSYNEKENELIKLIKGEQ